MAAINVVQRLFQRNDLRSARRTVAAALAQQFPLPLLPALAQLPLPLVGAAGVPMHFDDMLAHAERVLIAGTPGSGRRLALLQAALRWAGNERAPFPALITLPLIDDEAAPTALLTRWLMRTQPAVMQQLGPPLQTARAAKFGWGLLLDGLDELPEHRQHAWRTLLQDALHDTPLLVAVAADEPPWADTTRLTMQVPTPEIVASWVERFVPSERRAVVLTALAPRGALAPLAEHVLDLALLLWAARTELPASRAVLYERVVAGLLGARPAPTRDELQLLAAYDERPAAPAPGLLAVTAAGGLRFVHPHLRDFFAARQLVDENRYEAIHRLALPTRTELARFAASAAPDPATLYATLWADGQPAAENVLVLGQCLRERPASSAAWVVRITAALARLARAGDAAHRTAAITLLVQTAPVLDTALVTFARADSATRQAITRLLRLLPPSQAAARAAPLVYADAAPDELAWEVADLVSELPNTSTIAPPSARTALARWAYIYALASPTHRASLAATDAPALDALAHSTAGDARIARAAAALASDANLPLDARITALALLSGRQHPSALATLEQASRDPHPMVRQAAHAALVEHHPQQSHAALRQTALDPRAALDLRREATRSIAQRGDDTALLAQCARDTSLPLSARLESVMLLAQVVNGVAQLRDLLGDITASAFVRAAVARQLGQIGDHDALPLMLTLLNDGSTASVLAEHICGALGRIDSVAAIPALLALLAHTLDSDVLIAAIVALGQLQSETAIPHLHKLILHADQRLRDMVGAHGFSDTAPIVPEQLREPFGVQLATMLAEASTDADPPTTMIEFLRREADRVRVSAVQALRAIGSEDARAVLRDALTSGVSASTIGEIIAAIAALDGPRNATTLGELLSDTTNAPLVRWFAIQQLRDHAAGESALLQALGQSTNDPFTRGAVAEALGQRGTGAALAPLRQIADDLANDEHLRAQAILALGLLDDPTSEIALLRLVRTPGEPAMLRGMAAEHVPTKLSSEGRRVLRELLRTQRPVEPVAAGALRSLGRAGDREALPLMLRYAQDESAAVAQAALLALIDVGDAALAPVLVQITQNPHVDPSTRLQAVGTLLRIGGSVHMPLLRVALEQGSLPLRLQALEHLLDTAPPIEDLLPTLASRATPMPMRMRLFQHCAMNPAATATLASLLADASDDPYARGGAASALAQRSDPANTALFARVAADTTAFIGLRLRCIAALGVRVDTYALAALDALADDPAQPTSIRCHAAHVLIDQAVHALTPGSPPDNDNSHMHTLEPAGHGA